MTYPIPNEALDDRLAVVGSAGSGKTYMASGAVERILARKGRAIVVDPLGVWFGLRLMPDGKTPSPYNPVIFGGPHGDLPINEPAGALIGETVAGMAESCIVDLSEIGTKNGERRFMLAFLTALYRKTGGDLVHLIMDEADMFAPQKLDDKEGEAAKLLGMMETIVRRGRIKGFIPWLITQRPAVLNKNVLSQADGVVAMKLTGEHDRKAIGGWIEGQSDLATSKAILASLPAKQKGEGVLWIPGRGILDHVMFPIKTTFDSSRAPKRGEKKHSTALKPIDLGSLKERLATVETEIKANDPKVLKAEIARLRNLTNPPRITEIVPFTDLKAIDHANKVGFAAGYNLGRGAGFDEAMMLTKQAIAGIEKPAWKGMAAPDAPKPTAFIPKAGPRTVNFKPGEIKNIKAERFAPVVKNLQVTATGDISLTGPQRKLLQALAWWKAMGHDIVSKAQAATLSGWKSRGSNMRNRLAELSSQGLISYPSSGMIRLTDAGIAAAPEPDMGADPIGTIRGVLTGPQAKLFDELRNAGNKAWTKGEIGPRIDWEPGGSNMRNRLAELSSMEIIHYPERGMIALAPWVQELL